MGKTKKGRLLFNVSEHGGRQCHQRRWNKLGGQLHCTEATSPSCLTSGGLRPEGNDPALRVFTHMLSQPLPRINGTLLAGVGEVWEICCSVANNVHLHNLGLMKSLTQIIKSSLQQNGCDPTVLPTDVTNKSFHYQQHAPL